MTVTSIAELSAGDRMRVRVIVDRHGALAIVLRISIEKAMPLKYVLRAFLSLRFLLLLASIGAFFGATLLLWLGALDLLAAAELLSSTDGHDQAVTVRTLVLKASDAFLFAMVLIVFAYAIAFGIVINAPAEIEAQLPPWMKIESLDELKNTLVKVVLVVLIVDFATDLAEKVSDLSWNDLIQPLSVLVIAWAFRLLHR